MQMVREKSFAFDVGVPVFSQLDFGLWRARTNVVSDPRLPSWTFYGGGNFEVTGASVPNAEARLIAWVWLLACAEGSA